MLVSDLLIKWTKVFLFCSFKDVGYSENSHDSSKYAYDDSYMTAYYGILYVHGGPKSCTFFQRYGVLKNVQLFGATL